MTGSFGTDLMVAVAGGLAGGLVGFLLWRALKRVLPRPTLWLFVAVASFLGAKALPTALATLTQDQPETEAGTSVDPLGHPLLSVLAARDEAYRNTLQTRFASASPTRQALDKYAFTEGIAQAQTYLPRASDQAVLDVAEALALAMKTLGEQAPGQCYAWLYSGYGHDRFDYPRFAAALGQGQINYQFQVFAELAATADEQVPGYDEAAAEQAISRANFLMLQRAGLARAAMLSGEAPARSTEDKQALCSARYLFLSTILTGSVPAAALRHLSLQEAA